MILDKKEYPLGDVRRHLETGPIVLVTSVAGGRSNIMTMGWHMMMQFEPALFGCYIWEGNRSHATIRATRECAINIPTVDLIDAVVAIGNSHGGDKFAATGLTATASTLVKAPAIGECYASFECRLYDESLVGTHSLFIWEIVHAHVADIEAPRTLHYRGSGRFMVAGDEIDLSDRFRPENL